MSPTAPLSIAVHLAPEDRLVAMERDVRSGLSGPAKSLPPVWFYDHRGSMLFDQITRLPEYYPSRSERAILKAHAADIASLSEADTLVELGSGTSDKTTLILDAMARTGQLRRFVPFDVNEEVLRGAVGSIRAAYGIEVSAVVGDFHRHLNEIPRQGRRLIAFLGGTIGNLRPQERSRFLSDVAATMHIEDKLLLGVDLVKEPARLVAAYDDSAGVTAEFNRNVLAVLNAELDSDFDPGAFRHVATWNEVECWIEMRLRSEVSQRVHIGALDMIVEFDEGEELLTEISAKFTPDGIRQELRDAGFVLERSWTDDGGDYLLTLSRPDRGGRS